MDAETERGLFGTGYMEFDAFLAVPMAGTSGVRALAVLFDVCHAS